MQEGNSTFIRVGFIVSLLVTVIIGYFWVTDLYMANKFRVLYGISFIVSASAFAWFFVHVDFSRKPNTLGKKVYDWL